MGTRAVRTAALLVLAALAAVTAAHYQDRLDREIPRTAGPNRPGDRLSIGALAGRRDAAIGTGAAALLALLVTEAMERSRRKFCHPWATKRRGRCPPSPPWDAKSAVWPVRLSAR